MCAFGLISHSLRALRITEGLGKANLSNQIQLERRADAFSAINTQCRFIREIESEHTIFSANERGEQSHKHTRI